MDTKFQETERRLDAVTWKVDQLISVKTDTGNTQLLRLSESVKKLLITKGTKQRIIGVIVVGAGESLSPAKLVQSLADIKADFSSVVAEVEQLKAEQQAAMQDILVEFKNTMEAAEQLKGKLDRPDN